MILTEYLNNGTLIRHYSDKGVLLLQVETGAKYSDPVDVVPCMYTYEETDELIDVDESEEISDEEFVDMLEEVF
jgi:hypothetical protein